MTVSMTTLLMGICHGVFSPKTSGHRSPRLMQKRAKWLWQGLGSYHELTDRLIPRRTELEKSDGDACLLERVAGIATNNQPLTVNLAIPYVPGTTEHLMTRFWSKFSNARPNKSAKSWLGSTLPGVAQIPSRGVHALSHSPGFFPAPDSSDQFLGPVQSVAGPASCRALDDVADHFFQILLTPEVIFLTDLFYRRGHQIRIVGGAVRELLLGCRPYDIDFATDASVVEIKELAEDDVTCGRIRIIKAGVSDAFGSVKVRIDDREDFEMTSLRVNSSLDPGKSSSESTSNDSWFLDSARRDFTVNAMYLTMDGTLIDYHGGESDLIDGRVAFVGDSEARIAEDPLRILRYFRFAGRISDDLENFDMETLKVIRAKRSLLVKVSPRRIWLELKKILKGDHPGPIITKMHQLDLLRFMGFPFQYSEADMARFQRTCHRTASLRPHPCTLLCNFFESVPQAKAFCDKLTLNKEERQMLMFLMQHRENFKPHRSVLNESPGMKHYEDLMTAEQWPPGTVSRMRDQVIELFKYHGIHHWILGNNWRPTFDSLKEWDPPIMPITLYDLIQSGVSGWNRDWRSVFTTLTSDWKESGYSMPKDELLARAVEEVNAEERTFSFPTMKKAHQEMAHKTKKNIPYEDPLLPLMKRKNT